MKVYDPEIPWILENEGYDVSGTCFCIKISGINYVLTNAHNISGPSPIICVLDDTDYEMQVLFVMREYDLALLEPNDPDFWKHAKSLSLGKSPVRGDKIRVIGFPHGEPEISITSGVISRYSSIEYYYEYISIAIQTDAPVNSGNSGGPGVNKSGDVIGIAFKSRIGEDVQNMNYLIPTFLIKHFIELYENVKSGKINPGVTIPGIALQTQLSQTFRESRKFPGDGVLVTDTHVNCEINPGDYIIAIDSHKIGKSGMLPVYILYGDNSGDEDKISIGEYISIKLPGSQIALTVLRSSGIGSTPEQIVVKHTLPGVNYAISRIQRIPGYLFAGPMLFLILSDEYLELRKEGDFNYKHLKHILYNKGYTSHTEIIILSDIITGKSIPGVSVVDTYVLFSVNGKRVSTLADVYKEVISGDGEFLEFCFRLPKIAYVTIRRSEISNQKQLIMDAFNIDIPTYRAPVY